MDRDAVTKDRVARLRELVENAAGLGYVATHRWGRDAQVAMAIEEGAELAAALCHFARGRASEREVQGEIADVLVTALQLAGMFGWDETLDRLDEKLARLHSRLVATPPKVEATP